MKITLKIFALSLAVSFVTGCSQDDKDEKKKKLLGLSQEAMIARSAAQTVAVTDLKGNPIAGAEVLIGTEVDKPFTANFVQSDAQGLVAVPNDWNNAETITLSAKGFVRTTYMAQQPHGQAFKMRPLPNPAPLELKGNTSGYTLKDGDKLMDFSMMIPGFKKDELLAFNIDMFISPKTDEVTVYGQKLNLPSNTSIPKQKESYGFFPVTLDKPLYRMYFDDPGSRRISAIHGQFPFSQVVKEMQSGKSFVELINYFTILGGSVADANVLAPTQNLDIAINNLNFSQQRPFKSPVFNADEFLIAVSLNANREEYYPTDFKNVTSNVVQNLSTTPGSSPQLLVALKKKAEDMQFGGAKISAAFLPFEVNVQPSLLPLMEGPKLGANFTDFSITLPQVPADMAEAGSVFTLSTVIKNGTGKDYKEEVTKHWEVYSDSWVSSVNLPKWPNDKAPEGVKRWEALLMASDNNKLNIQVDLTTRLFETVTHATHSATDF